MSSNSWSPKYLFPEVEKNEIHAKGAGQGLGDPLLLPGLSFLSKYLPWC